MLFLLFCVLLRHSDHLWSMRVDHWLCEKPTPVSIFLRPSQIVHLVSLGTRTPIGREQITCRTHCIYFYYTFILAPLKVRLDQKSHILSRLKKR